MKKKRMTQKEIALRAMCKKDLQARGVLPPDKPRLNRRKFAKEVVSEYNATMYDYEGIIYLHRALGCMVAEDMREVTPEEVGVLKLLKIAIETRKFMEALKEEGRSEYTIGEYADKVVRPIIKL